MHLFIVIAIVLLALVFWVGCGLLNITIFKLHYRDYYDDVLGAFIVIFGPGATAVLLLSFPLRKMAKGFEHYADIIVRALRDRIQQVSCKHERDNR
jgi:hypothetical protein